MENRYKWDSFPEKILRYIRNYEPTYQQIYEALGYSPEREDVKATLEELINKGHIVKVSGRYYALPASERSSTSTA